jgi:hypothetical protein
MTDRSPDYLQAKCSDLTPTLNSHDYVLAADGHGKNHPPNVNSSARNPEHGGLQLPMVMTPEQMAQLDQIAKLGPISVAKDDGYFQSVKKKGVHLKDKPLVQLSRLIRSNTGDRLELRVGETLNTTVPNEQRESFGEFPDQRDVEFRKLVLKELQHKNNKGDELTPAENAHLASKRKFPNQGDESYRTMLEKQLLGQKLTPEEDAHLAGKMKFPDPADDYYRGLYERQELPNSSSASLTRNEAAVLSSKLEFPDKADEKYRGLAEKMALGDRLEIEDLAHLIAKRQFPKDEMHRDLAEKSVIGLCFSWPLTAKENSELRTAQAKMPGFRQCDLNLPDGTQIKDVDIRSLAAKGIPVTIRSFKYTNPFLIDVWTQDALRANPYADVRCENPKDGAPIYETGMVDHGRVVFFIGGTQGTK